MNEQAKRGGALWAWLTGGCKAAEGAVEEVVEEAAESTAGEAAERAAGEATEETAEEAAGCGPTAPRTAGGAAAGTAGKPVAEPGRSRHFPTAGDLLAFLGIFLIAQVAGMFTALLCGCTWPDAAAAASADEAVGAAARAAIARFNGLTYCVAMSLTVAGFLFYRHKRGGRHIPVKWSRRGLNPALLLWGALFMVSVSVVIEPLLARLPEVPDAYGEGFWAFVTLVLAAPLFEEYIFRGLLLESLRARYGVILAWVVSSLLFGIVHLHPALAVNAMLVGAILGFIYIAARSLWASILLHLFNNGLAYLLLVTGAGRSMLIESIDSPTLYVILYIAALAVCIVSGWGMRATLHRLKQAEAADAAGRREPAAGPEQP